MNRVNNVIRHRSQKNYFRQSFIIDFIMRLTTKKSVKAISESKYPIRFHHPLKKASRLHTTGYALELHDGVNT
jgi:hypothetical protein